MDRSEEYVNMCRAANEIQSGHKYNSGDFYMGCPYEDGYYSVSGKISTYGSYDEFNMVLGDVWIPRQDQLQEMSGKPWFTYDHTCRLLIIDILQASCRDYSKEQVGLMLVMFEQYHKKWIGEEWA